HLAGRRSARAQELLVEDPARAGALAGERQQEAPWRRPPRHRRSLAMLVLIAGGGTGGHLFPGIAVAEELRSRGHEVVFVGTDEGLEARVLPEHGWPLELIEVRGIKGGGLAGALKGMFAVPKALLRCGA